MLTNCNVRGRKMAASGCVAATDCKNATRATLSRILITRCTITCISRKLFRRISTHMAVDLEPPSGRKESNFYQIARVRKKPNILPNDGPLPHRVEFSSSSTLSRKLFFLSFLFFFFF